MTESAVDMPVATVFTRVQARRNIAKDLRYAFGRHSSVGAGCLPAVTGRICYLHGVNGGVKFPKIGGAKFPTLAPYLAGPTSLWEARRPAFRFSRRR